MLNKMCTYKQQIRRQVYKRAASDSDVVELARQRRAHLAAELRRILHVYVEVLQRRVVRQHAGDVELTHVGGRRDL